MRLQKDFEPYISLWASVLETAVNDLYDIKFRKSAIYWFESDNNEIGSFLWVCDLLKLRPTKIKERVMV